MHSFGGRGSRHVGGTQYSPGGQKGYAREYAPQRREDDGQLEVSAKGEAQFYSRVRTRTFFWKSLNQE